MRFCGEWGLSIRNTFQPEVDEGTLTCDFDKRRPAKQIDYILSDMSRVKGRVLQSTATVSDLRALIADIPQKSVAWRSFGVRSKAKMKPIGWIKTDQSYNHKLQDELGLSLFPIARQIVETKAKFVYLDGSKATDDKRRGRAGLCFGIFESDPKDDDCSPQH